jgi:hypothetical protein
MPEATVHEHRDAPSWEQDVDSARHILGTSMLEEAQTAPMQR